MGRLTDDMTRLCREIRVSHYVRRARTFNLGRNAKSLKDSVSRMRAGFRAAHAGMAGDDSVGEGQGAEIAHIHPLPAATIVVDDGVVEQTT